MRAEELQPGRFWSTEYFAAAKFLPARSDALRRASKIFPVLALMEAGGKENEPAEPAHFQENATIYLR